MFLDIGLGLGLELISIIIPRLKKDGVVFGFVCVSLKLKTLNQYVEYHPS